MGAMPSRSARASSMYEAYRSPTFLFGVRCVVAGTGAILDDGADVLFGLFGEGCEGAVIGAVGGDLGLGEPGAIDRAEQIVLETHGRVEVGPIDAAGERLGGLPSAAQAASSVKVGRKRATKAIS